MKRYHMSLLSLAVLLCLLAACSPVSVSPQEEGYRDVSIAMGFVPNVQFTPMYVALERGYFEEEGLNIELDYGMETDLLQQVGANKVPFAIVSGDQTILARGNGLPVTYVFNWYRRFPVCIVSMASSGITEPADLVGRTVGTTALEGASYLGWLAFLKQVGIPAADIDLQVIGYTQVPSLVEGRVDAAISYAMNEPVQLKAAGHEVNVFYLDSYTHLVSNGIVTNDMTIEEEPELVERVVRAFRRGLQDTIDDPDAAFEITRKAIPEMDDDTAVLQRAVLEECVVFWRGDNLGASVPEHWKESVELLQEIGLLETDVDPDGLYTNTFVE